MALYINTAADLVIRVLDEILHDYKGGTATSGSQTTVVDTVNRHEPDDYFQNTVPVSKVYIVRTTDDLAPQGETREATDFTQTSPASTITTKSFSVTVGTGDIYAVTVDYNWDNVLAYINMAIDEATRRGAFFEKTDHSVELTASVYEYAIPENFTHIYQLTMLTSNGAYETPIPSSHYRIIRGTTPARIHFIRMPEDQQYEGHYYGELWADAELTAGRTLRIEGLQRQTKLVENHDTCNIDPNFICWQAAAFLHAARIRRPENEPDDHRTQYGVCQSMADKIKIKKQFPPHCKRVTN